MYTFSDLIDRLATDIKKMKNTYEHFADSTWRPKLTVQDIDDKINAGADLNERNALLHKALAQGQSEVVERALNINANVSSKNPVTGGNILHSAAQGGLDMSVMLNKYFLKDVSINAQDDLYQRTPIIVSAKYDKPKTFEQLANAGADLTLTDKEGNTALHFFSKFAPDLKSIHNPTLKQALNIKNNQGFTPLMCAIKNKNHKMVKQLIDAGADKSIQNNGITALDYLETLNEPNSQLISAFNGQEVKNRHTNDTDTFTFVDFIPPDYPTIHHTAGESTLTNKLKSLQEYTSSDKTDYLSNNNTVER